MKAANGALITHLATSKQFVIADLYTITLSNGTVLRYTSFDATLTDGVNTWVAGGPVITRGQTRSVIGLEVDTLDLTVSPKDTDLIGSLTWYQAAQSGVLDSAQVKLERAFLNGLSIIGKVIMFVGSVAPITISFPLEITVNSLVECLAIQMPRNLYQAACQHSLFDSGCALARASWATTGSVSGSPSLTSFMSVLAPPAGYFDVGSLIFTSGPNAGIRRTVKSWDGVTLRLLNPLPALPVVGNNFTIYPGCNKTQATCASKFNNVVNFKGMPYVPVPETAL